MILECEVWARRGGATHSGWGSSAGRRDRAARPGRAARRAVASPRAEECAEGRGPGAPIARPVRTSPVGLLGSASAGGARALRWATAGPRSGVDRLPCPRDRARWCP